LAVAPNDGIGVHFGVGDGSESGPFLARIAISRLSNGGIGIDYEATSREQGVQHVEHSMLAAGSDGRERLFLAHQESPFVTELVESEAGSGRFVQPEPVGPYVMEVVIGRPSAAELTYA